MTTRYTTQAQMTPGKKRRAEAVVESKTANFVPDAQFAAIVRHRETAWRQLTNTLEIYKYVYNITQL